MLGLLLKCSLLLLLAFHKAFSVYLIVHELKVKDLKTMDMYIYIDMMVP